MTLDNIKLGIFDHSGVLSDDRLPVYEANMVLLKHYNHDRITFEKWLEASKASAGELVLSFGVQASKKEIDGLYEKVYAQIVTEENIKPTMYPDVPDVLEDLQEKGMKLAIVSSHPRSNLIKELQEYEIIDFFDKISGDPMPKTERLQSICSDYQVLPQESFFVEDTIIWLKSWT